MQQAKTENHTFRFTIDSGSKERLQELADKHTGGNISRLMVRIIRNNYSLMEEIKENGMNPGSRYAPVCKDPDIPRETLSVILPGEVYEIIKGIHTRMNFFSMAQVVRRLISAFI